MNTHNPQEAFFTWLGQALARAIDAVRGPAVEGQHAPGSPVSQLTY
jgi:hypothetical protein